VALIVFLAWEPRPRADPLIDPRFFRRRAVSRGRPATAVDRVSRAMGGFLFLNTLYLQDVRGFSPLGGRTLPAADGGDDGGLRARWPGGSSLPGGPGSRW